MIVTEVRAGAIQCPLLKKACMGSDCMAWRWFDPPVDPDAPEFRRDCRWPKDDDDLTDAEFRKLAKSKKEWKRPDDLPSDWVWVPAVITKDRGDDDFAGAYWEEPADAPGARLVEACARRRGFCGQFGLPQEPPANKPVRPV